MLDVLVHLTPGGADALAPAGTYALDLAAAQGGPLTGLIYEIDVHRPDERLERVARGAQPHRRHRPSHRGERVGLGEDADLRPPLRQSR